MKYKELHEQIPQFQYQIFEQYTQNGTVIANDNHDDLSSLASVSSPVKSVAVPEESRVTN